MIHPQRLLADLQSLLPRLDQDILAYGRTRLELEAHLEAEYTKARETNRTAEHFVACRKAQITQAAAKRGLYARHPWSVGGGGASELSWAHVSQWTSL